MFTTARRRGKALIHIPREKEAYEEK